MLAINTSSIKSPALWQVHLQPSKFFAALYTVLMLLALAALWHCPVSAIVRSSVMLITCLGGIAIFLPTRQPQTLSLHDDGLWQLKAAGKHMRGRLSTGSYRSQLLVVVAIKPESGSTRHAVVWRDSVDAAAMSFLHIQLSMTSSQQLSSTDRH